MNQRRVLLGLQAGLKLHEVLREPHMPSAKMVDEWRTVPEFDYAFVTASTEGAAYRAKQLANRPAVKSAALATELAVELMPEPVTVMVASSPVVIAEAAKLIVTITNGNSHDDALKQELMRRLRTGEPSKLITKSTSGFYADKLSEWRKNADFVVEWNKAKAVGRDTRKTNSYLIERLTQLATEAVSEPLFESIPQPAPAETAPVPAPVNPAHEYLPEHKPTHRFLILKAETSFEFLMSEAEAREAAAQYTADSKDAYYVAQLVAVSTPMTTAVIFPIN